MPNQCHMIFTILSYLHLLVSIDAYENVSHAGSNYTNTTVLKETDHFSIFGFNTLHSILGLAGAGLVLVIIILIIIAVAMRHCRTVEVEDSVDKGNGNNKDNIKSSGYCIVCQGEEPA